MTRRSLCISVVALAGLLTARVSSRADSTDTALAKSAILESNVAYLQVGRVGKNLPDDIRAAQDALSVSNKIAGTILDLRFAGGDDLDSAKAAADLFGAKKLPLAVLVNHQTSGASVALASELRAARAGLIFQSVAGTSQTNSETTASVQPDITVAIGAEDERALMENPYASAAALNDTNAPAATNNLLPFVDHTSEADLVRAKIKDGDENAIVPRPRQTEAQKLFIRDPVLARAVDLIKGLAVVRASHS